MNRKYFFTQSVDPPIIIKKADLNCLKTPVHRQQVPSCVSGTENALRVAYRVRLLNNACCTTRRGFSCGSDTLASNPTSVVRKRERKEEGGERETSNTVSHIISVVIYDNAIIAYLPGFECSSRESRFSIERLLRTSSTVINA